MIDDTKPIKTVYLKLHIDKDRTLLEKICSINETRNSIEKGLSYWGMVTELLFNYKSREILFILRTTDRELISLVNTEYIINFSNFVFIGNMKGARLLNQYEALYFKMILRPNFL